MSTITLTDPNVIRVRHALAIGLIAILILTSFVLIVTAILVIVLSTTQDAYQADLIPVVQNSVTPVPVATPPIVHISPSPSEVSTPVQASQPHHRRTELSKCTEATRMLSIKWMRLSFTHSYLI